VRAFRPPVHTVCEPPTERCPRRPTTWPAPVGACDDRRGGPETCPHDDLTPAMTGRESLRPPRRPGACDDGQEGERCPDDDLAPVMTGREAREMPATTPGGCDDRKAGGDDEGRREVRPR
jgi:hypothetical protein